MNSEMEICNFDVTWGRVKQVTGWSDYKELATFVNSSSQSISGVKKRGKFPIDWAFKIAVAFNSSTDWLLTGEGDMKRGSGADVDFRNIPRAQVPDTELADIKATLEKLGIVFQPFDETGRDRRPADDDVIDLIGKKIDEKSERYGIVDGIKEAALDSIIYKVYSNRFIESADYRMKSLESIVDCLFKLATGKTTDQGMNKERNEESVVDGE